MSEVDEMKKSIVVQNQQRNEAQNRINLAIKTVDRDRKEKRDESNRPK